jgi:hypothetical protein
MSIKRIDRGRGHSYQIDGKKADGVTTLIGDGVPKPALINWAANVTAAAAVDNWATLGELPPSERLDKLKKARWETLDIAGKRGTEVHALAEKLAHNEEVDVPEELAGHVESAVKFLDEWQIETLLTETVIASRKWMYCGTFDLLAKLPDGRIALCDWKTTRSGIFGEVGLQLAAYANADAYLDADQVEHAMADLHIDCGLAIWIRADGYDVYEVDITEKTFKTFQHVAWLARRLKTLREDAISPALDRPAVGAA